MTRDQGKGLAKVISDASLVDKISSSEPTIDRNTQTRLGDQLRAMYDDLLHQPVPDRFKDLLERLENTRSEEETR